MNRYSYIASILMATTLGVKIRESHSHPSDTVESDATPPPVVNNYTFNFNEPVENINFYGTDLDNALVNGLKEAGTQGGKKFDIVGAKPALIDEPESAVVEESEEAFANESESSREWDAIEANATESSDDNAPKTEDGGDVGFFKKKENENIAGRNVGGAASETKDEEENGVGDENSATKAPKTEEDKNAIENDGTKRTIDTKSEEKQPGQNAPSPGTVPSNEIDTITKDEKEDVENIGSPSTETSINVTEE